MADAENDTLNDAKDDLRKENEERNKDEQGSESTPANTQNEVRLEVKRVKTSFKMISGLPVTNLLILHLKLGSYFKNLNIIRRIYNGVLR